MTASRRRWRRCELDERTTELTRSLVDLGVEPDRLVGVGLTPTISHRSGSFDGVKKQRIVFVVGGACAS